MGLLSVLYWVVLILAAIGSFAPFPFAPRLNSVAGLVLFILIGLRVFRIPL